MTLTASLSLVRRVIWHAKVMEVVVVATFLITSHNCLLQIYVVILDRALHHTPIVSLDVDAGVLVEEQLHPIMIRWLGLSTE